MSDDSDDDFGPKPAAAEDAGEDGAAARPRKKRRKLADEAVYAAALPSGERYERSYMHRDVVTHVAVCAETDFLVTGSDDGHVKFWKKVRKDVEFVKTFHAHLGPLAALAASADGRLVASV